jgi:hypothetical protein
VSDGSKECQRCGRAKARAEYSPAKWLEVHAWCKACHSEYNRQRYIEKGAEVRARVAAWQAANRERDKARRRAAYWRDVEASRARARESARIQNPKRRGAKQAWARADRAANPEKWRAKGRRDYRNNPLARKETQWRRRAQKEATEYVPLTPEQLARKWRRHRGLCWMCKEPAVEWDHVRPLSKGGAHALRNLRPACRACNASKGDVWPFPTLI